MASRNEQPSNVIPIGYVEGTGEQVLGKKKAVGFKGKAKKRSHRVALVDMDIVSQIEMTQMEWRVFTTIARFIPDKGGIEARVSLAEVATRLGMKPSNVSRIVHDLVERDILLRVRRGVWEVNPHILYNGQFEEWNSILDGYIQPKAKR